MMKRTADVADLKQQPLVKKYKSAKDDTECKLTTTTRERVLKSKDCALHIASFLSTHGRVGFAIATGNKVECKRLLGGPESAAYWSARVLIATKHVHRSLDELALTFIHSTNDWARKAYQPANELWFVPEDITAARHHLLTILHRHQLKDTAYDFVRKFYSGTFLDAEHDSELAEALGFESNAYEPQKTLAIPAIAHAGALAAGLAKPGKRDGDWFISVFIDHFWPSKQGTCEQCRKSDVKLIRGNKGKWRCRLCRDGDHYDNCKGDCDLKECPKCHERIPTCFTGTACPACIENTFAQNMQALFG